MEKAKKVKQQKDVVAQREGDRWYRRNIGALKPACVSGQPLARFGEELGWHGKRVLEIGCANGYRLEWLRRELSCSVAGVDLSAAAVADGKEAFPGLDLQVAGADDLPFEAESFDVVMLGFCLYLCDRGDLFAIAAECHRVLRSPGYLAITDFSVPSPRANDYHHDAHLKTYKMNYSAMFLWNPAYELIRQQIEPVVPGESLADPDGRIGWSVLLREDRHAWPRVSAWCPNPARFADQ